RRTGIRTDARGFIARSGLVTLVRCCADYRVCTRADATLAEIRVGAGGSVGAGRAVRRTGIRTDARGFVERSGLVTLVRCCADYRVCTLADAALAGIRLRAGVSVAAGRAVRSTGIRTDARGFVARSGLVTLVRCCADYRVCTDADA